MVKNFLILCFLSLLVSGCGHKTDLRLPEEQTQQSRII
jgi:predicted small lipoprotein YifL